MKIAEFSTEDLIQELSKRKGIQYVTAGAYQEFSVVGKYTHHDIKFPEKYGLLIVECAGC
ncbi:hypothetical protein [Lactiplantibacillus paraxiangfangensis]|uniref:hypothetical protein n=1 Tax=Lactiplantibacillus paraxiangfangensis TaxID=3076224 RepID=UPI0030C6946E